MQTNESEVERQVMFRIETWICTTLFAVGIIFGMTYLNLSGYTLTGQSVSTADPIPDVREKIQDQDLANNSDIYERLNQNNAPEGGSDLVGDENSFSGNTQRQLSVDELAQEQALRQADLYLVAGNYALAMENYYDFDKFSTVKGSAILLREAYCCEMQRKFDQAESKYYRALTGATGENHRLISVAGLARCLVQKGNRLDAIGLLAEQNLRIDHYDGIPAEVRSQVVFQFAKTLEQNAIGDQSDLTLSTTMAFEDILPDPQLYLEAIDDPGKATQSEDSTAELRIDVLQRPSSSMNVISVSISAKLEPLAILLGHIAANADHSLVLSQQAQFAIQNRSRTVELQSVPLSSLLDQLLVPLDLVWYQSDSELHIIDQSEVDASVAPRQFSFDSAHRAYRRFELTFDDSRRRQASMLSRASMSMIQKRLDAAANQFQELSQTQPSGEVLAKLFFNQAKLYLLLDRMELANRSLYLAVDQSQSPNIQASGYCLLGENLLAKGELETSIKIGRRGLAMAINDQQKRMASLNLARAYLLNDDPYMANKVLFDNRDHYADGKSRSIASILGAYARFIGVRDENRMRTARNRLLTAVTMVPEDHYQTFADAYVAGLAYERLGFREQSVEKLLLSLSMPRVGSWRRRILFEMGILQNRLDRKNESAVSFETVIQAKDDSWNRLAMENLAKIYLDLDQPQKSIDVCKQLWALPLVEARKKSVLLILGDAFERKGEHYTAALCFAGMVPDLF